MHGTPPYVPVLFAPFTLLFCAQAKKLLHTYNVTDKTYVNCVSFVEREGWLICGTGGGHIYVYDYNSKELIKEHEAHTEWVGGMAVHPQLPYLLTGSGDYTIRLWDWSQGWKCLRTYKGHTHYVRSVAWSPDNGKYVGGRGVWGKRGLERERVLFTLHPLVPPHLLQSLHLGLDGSPLDGWGDRTGTALVAPAHPTPTGGFLAVGRVALVPCGAHRDRWGLRSGFDGGRRGDRAHQMPPKRHCGLQWVDGIPHARALLMARSTKRAPHPH